DDKSGRGETSNRQPSKPRDVAEQGQSLSLAPFSGHRRYAAFRRIDRPSSSRGFHTKVEACAPLFSPANWWIDAETEGGLEMAHGVESVARRASMTVWFAAFCLLILSPGMVYAQGIGEYFQTHTHGYLDNFTILRNDTFKDDYHVASSRYRLDLQFSGPIGSGSQPWGLPFDRFEYFLDIRPEYESAYDISDRFGSDPGISTSGRGVPPTSGAGGTADLLRAFGFNTHDFEEIYAKSNLRIPSPRSPSVKFLNPQTQ